MSRRTSDTEPYQIKGIDALFGNPSVTKVAAEVVLLSQLVLPSQQPRRYFEPQAMQDLVASVKQHGILQPLLVRRKEHDLYELVAGERRYRAAVEVGLTEVPVVIRDLTDEEAWQFALLENLQREDLNPVEETEGILQLLALKLNTTSESVINLLNQAAHPERPTVDNVIHTPEWQDVQEVFTTVGKLTPESFRTNRLPLLKMPDDVLNVLRQGRIEYTKARAIARLKDEEQRQALLEVAISENLSLTQIKERMKSIVAASSESNVSKPSSLKSRMDTAYRLVQKSDLWNDLKKQKRLEKLIAEMEALVSKE